MAITLGVVLAAFGSAYSIVRLGEYRPAWIVVAAVVVIVALAIKRPRLWGLWAVLAGVLGVMLAAHAGERRR